MIPSALRLKPYTGDAIPSTNMPTLRLMDKILHDLKDPKLRELWYIPFMGNAGFCPSAVTHLFRARGGLGLKFREN